MFRSLHRKLVVILMLLVVSVMAVVGTILVNSITSFYAREFRQQLAQVLTTERIETFQAAARGDNPDQALYEVVSAYSSSLGIDNYRNVYILDGETGGSSRGPIGRWARRWRKRPISSPPWRGSGRQRPGGGRLYGSGRPAGDRERPLSAVHQGHHPGDAVADLHDFFHHVQAILFGLVVAVLLSFLLSKTITNPIENLTAAPSVWPPATSATRRWYSPAMRSAC